MDDNKSKALAAALSQIEKQFGKGSIMRLGDTEAVEDIQAVSTGSLGLDIALGIGGLPRGRIIEIYGPESSGKTTLTLSVIAQMQKLGGTAAFIDAEHALDPSYAERIGVDLDEHRLPADIVHVRKVGDLDDVDELVQLLHDLLDDEAPVVQRRDVVAHQAASAFFCAPR